MPKRLMSTSGVLAPRHVKARAPEAARRERDEIPETLRHHTKGRHPKAFDEETSQNGILKNVFAQHTAVARASAMAMNLVALFASTSSAIIRDLQLSSAARTSRVRMVSSWYDSGVRMGNDEPVVTLPDSLIGVINAAALAREDRRAEVETRLSERAAWSYGAQFNGRFGRGRIAEAGPVAAAFTVARASAAPPSTPKGVAVSLAHNTIPPRAPQTGVVVMTRNDWSRRAQEGASLGGD